VALSFLAKAAICVCPPVAMATAVATVPPIKRAVHRATAKPAIRPASAGRPTSAAALPADAPCIPVAPGAGLLPGPVAPLVTFADPGLLGLDTPGTGGGVGTPGGIGGGGGFPGIGVPPIGPGSGGPTPDNPVTPTPSPTPTPTPPQESPIPEPATWLLMIGGFALAGTAMRRRRTARAGFLSGGLRLGSFGSAALGIGEAAGGAAATLPAMSVATKAILCVCPPLALASAVAVVPPVRSAVHAATAPRIVPLSNYAVLPPCPEVTFGPAVAQASAAAGAAPAGPMRVALDG